MKKISFLIVTLFLVVVHAAQAQKKSKPISIVTELNRDSIVLIDVRTPEEFEAGHIQNAMNINFYDEDFVTKIQALKIKKPIYVYCRSGHRSANATKALEALGIDVTNLEGGYNAFSALRPMPH